MYPLREYDLKNVVKMKKSATYMLNIKLCKYDVHLEIYFKRVLRLGPYVFFAWYTQSHYSQ